MSTAMLVSLCLLSGVVGADEFSGQTQLDDQISDKKKEILIIESQVAEQERKIEQLKLQERTLYNQLELLDAEQQAAQLELDAAQLQLDQVNEDITDLDGQIVETQQDLDRQIDIFMNHVNETYILSQTSFLEVMVESDTMSDLMRRIEYQEIMDEQNEEILTDLEIIKGHLEEQKTALGEKRDQLENLKAEVEERKREIDEQVQVKQTLIAQTQQSEAQYKNIIDANAQSRRQLEAEIASIEAEIRRRIEEERQRLIDAGEIEVDEAPSRAGYIWPTSGEITMYFGEKYPDWMLRAYPWLNNPAYMYHTGLDIAAPLGTAVRSPKDGEVVMVRDFGNLGYGRMVMIDHKDGAASLYGHLNSFNVSLGQQVVQGQVIGGMGSSGFSTGSHLHFEIRENGKLVDPLIYLP